MKAVRERAAPLHQAVDRRRLDLRIPQPAHSAEGQIVGDQEQDVRTLRRRQLPDSGNRRRFQEVSPVDHPPTVLPKKSPIPADKLFVSRFFEDAIRVFETAAQGTDNLGILVDASGALRIVPADGWRPDALREHYGARSVFQVSHGPSGVRVEARSGGYSCVLSSSRPLLPS